MNITRARISRLWIAGSAILGLATQGGCISGDSDPEADTGGSGGSAGQSGSAGTTGGSGGSAGTTGGSGGTTGGSAGTSGGSTGTVCAAPIILPAAKPAIADFDNYNGSADLATWSFPLGGDAATGVFAGTFGYGDEPDGFPEAFEMVPGNDSTYALSISDTLAEEYGGGMGLWLSECLDATAFTGISFWARGNSPSGDAKLSLFMEETTSIAAATPGTCTGTDETCIQPSFTFPVTDTWTQVRVAWSGLTAGNAAGTTVVPDGHNIWQIQFVVSLVWAPDDAGVSHPTPAEYELEVDDITLY